MDFEKDRPMFHFSLRQKLAMAGVALGAIVWLSILEDDSNSHKEKIEECVSDLTDTEVSIGSDPETGRIFRPEEIYDEVTACIRAKGDPKEAALYLDNN